MKISFIIPVYKVEKYLDDCVQSIVSQSYRNIEVLLVDDGSPDSCPALCDGWANADPRIKAFHKFNGGLSDARNYGLQKATGDYVIFVDSDDFWCNKDSLFYLVSIAKEKPQVDFIGYNCSYFYQKNNRYKSWVKYSEELAIPVSGDKAMQLLVKSGTFPMSACLKMIKRTVLLDENILFKKGQTAEDISWFINLLEKTNSCLFVNEYIYAYRQNVENSITASIGERSFNNLLDIIKTEIEKIKSRSFSSSGKDALYSFLAYELSILVAGISDLPKEKQGKKRKELKSLCWLFKFTQNPKTYLVSNIFHFLGFSITERILRIYNVYRRNKG